MTIMGLVHPRQRGSPRSWIPSSPSMWVSTLTPSNNSLIIPGTGRREEQDRNCHVPSYSHYAIQTAADRSVSVPLPTNIDKHKRTASSGAVEEGSAALNEEDTKAVVQGEQSEVGAPSIKALARPTLHDSLPNTPKLSSFGLPTTR